VPPRRFHAHTSTTRQPPSPPLPPPNQHHRARKAIARLLGPSLSPDNPSGPVSAPAAPVEAGTLFYFAYGANLAYRTLARRDVRPMGRDPAMVADASVRMRFRHRGGERHVTACGLGVGVACCVQLPPCINATHFHTCMRRCNNTTCAGYATLETMPQASSPSPSPSSSNNSASSANGSGAAKPRYPPFDPRVHGVLYKLRVEDLAKLAKHEGGYVLKDVEVRFWRQ